MPRSDLSTAGRKKSPDGNGVAVPGKLSGRLTVVFLGLPREFLQKRLRNSPEPALLSGKTVAVISAGRTVVHWISRHQGPPPPPDSRTSADQPHIAQKLRFPEFHCTDNPYGSSLCQLQIMAHLGETHSPEYLSDQAFHDLRKLFLHFICNFRSGIVTEISLLLSPHPIHQKIILTFAVLVFAPESHFAPGSPTFCSLPPLHRVNPVTTPCDHTFVLFPVLFFNLPFPPSHSYLNLQETFCQLTGYQMIRDRSS